MLSTFTRASMQVTTASFFFGGGGGTGGYSRTSATIAANSAARYASE